MIREYIKEDITFWSDSVSHVDLLRIPLSQSWIEKVRASSYSLADVIQVYHIGT